MNIPFLDLLKKAKSRLFPPSGTPAAVAPRPAVTAKSPDERLSKTVLPNMTRTLAPPDPFRVAAGSPSSGMTRGRELSASVALALEPKGDRSICLRLSDVLEHLPGGYLKPTDSFDGDREVSLKGAEIEKGMATGNPTVSLGAIYEQAPEIFERTIAPDDMTQVSLPYEKVLQQFENLQVRADQFVDQAVPQVETPFLQVTIEDNQRFGTTLPPLQTSAQPPVKVQHATAAAFAKAEPEAVTSEKVTPNISGRRPISVTPPNQPPPTADSSSSPARIPFHLPPNGAGAPASERVPASSGPPVPTSSPKSPAPNTPARIPFKITDLQPKFTLVPGTEPKEETTAPEKVPVAKKDNRKMRLSLDVVMRNVPAFQLKGSLPEIPGDARIELPYSLIEPQLASGRIAIDPKVFEAAIPEAYRDLFVVDSTETPVLLPLQEVLKNLPDTALQMRTDQVREETVNYFETPFSHHANEDEKRFKGGASDTAKPAETEKDLAKTEAGKSDSPPAKKAEEPVAAKLEISEPKKGADVAEPEKSEGKEEKNEAKEFVTRATALPGVAACSVTFADGLSLAGNLPAEIGADGLCAMAPSVLQKVEKHMLETKLGPLTAMTLHCAKSPVSFFMQGNVCLAVLHADRQLESTTQEKLVEMVKELSQVYTQPETADVHH
jgi:predicted regulator of Ras-like GTPase activity (Roadblock/LC7/MglB family)